MPDLSAEQWSHYTARVNGINIHYVMEGEGDPLVFLHGWPEFWYSWRRQIPEFSQRYQVIVPDLRGFGHSDKPFHGYDTRTSASDVYELVRQLGHDRVRIVSHDIGARVAFRFALDHEESVQKIAFLDATPALRAARPTGAVGGPGTVALLLPPAIRPARKAAGRAGRSVPAPYNAGLDHQQVPADPRGHRRVRSGLLRSGRASGRVQLLPGRRLPGPRRLAGRRGPATVHPRPVPLRYPPRAHCGSHGRRAVGRRLAGRDPGVQSKHLGDYGHFLQWECPDAVNEALTEFLGD